MELIYVLVGLSSLYLIFDHSCEVHEVVKTRA